MMRKKTFQMQTALLKKTDRTGAPGHSLLQTHASVSPCSTRASQESVFKSISCFFIGTVKSGMRDTENETVEFYKFGVSPCHDTSRIACYTPRHQSRANAWLAMPRRTCLQHMFQETPWVTRSGQDSAITAQHLPLHRALRYMKAL